MLEGFKKKFFTNSWIRSAPSEDKNLRCFKLKLFEQVSGAVLELGPGTGVNFSYFPRNISWMGVEPNTTFQKILSENPNRPDNFQLVNNIKDIQSESINTVVSSIVLCSVQDLKQTLLEIKRVLKKGGYFLCVEHIGAPRGSFLRFAQYIIKPFSKFFGGGCEPDRDILQAIQETGFSEIKSSLHKVHFTPLIFSPTLVCSARK
jgi:SAM-dependent methyltransferase